MHKLFGYAGRELRVDLSTGKLEDRALDEGLMRKFGGGAGYGAYVLMNEMKAGVDPLGADNILMFATSPLSHSKVPGGGSVIVCFKSPLTGCWGEARSGGDFGIEMKRAGFDFIIIKGQSAKPVYLEIIGGKAALRDATGLKGQDVYEKDKRMKTMSSAAGAKHTSVMCIGRAGENLVKYASIMCEDRAAGRAGGGAVMGAKNLMGVVVSGSAEIEIYDKELFSAVTKEAISVVVQSATREGMHNFGTVGDLPANDEDGDLPTKNWRSNSFGKGAELFDHFQEQNFIKPHPCYAGCPVGCGRIVQVKDGKYQTPVHEGGEYETIAAFTAFVMNDDVDLAVHCDYLCNKYGVDTISCAANIAFAMDCYESGAISQEETGGVPFVWGDANAVLQGIEMIVNRRHIGALLADGVRAAASKLGKGSEQHAVHVKGLEGPAHDPRSGKMLGITYGTGNRGMCHIHPLEGMAYDRGKMTWGLLKYGIKDPETLDRWDEAGKGTDCKLLQDALSAPDVFSTCKFLMYAGVTIEHWAKMLSALTGWDVNDTGVLEVCERAYNLQRMFNIREGIRREHDMLPRRALSLPEFGRYATVQECVIQDFDAILDEYYAARGWDLQTGVPTTTKLEELGLGEYLRQLSVS